MEVDLSLQFLEFREAVDLMMKRQQEYWSTRTQEKLKLAMQAEKHVKSLIASYKPTEVKQESLL